MLADHLHNIGSVADFFFFMLGMIGLHVLPSKVEFRTSAAGGIEERKQSGNDAKNYLCNLSQCLKHISRICFSCMKKIAFTPADMVSLI
jgi:hypothetical protein